MNQKSPACVIPPKQKVENQLSRKVELLTLLSLKFSALSTRRNTGKLVFRNCPFSLPLRTISLLSWSLLPKDGEGDELWKTPCSLSVQFDHTIVSQTWGYVMKTTLIQFQYWDPKSKLDYRCFLQLHSKIKILREEEGGKTLKIPTKAPTLHRILCEWVPQLLSPNYNYRHMYTSEFSPFFQWGGGGWFFMLSITSDLVFINYSPFWHIICVQIVLKGDCSVFHNYYNIEVIKNAVKYLS